MTGTVVSLTGAPVRTGPRQRPVSRLSGCPVETALRDLVPLNNCLIALEAEMRRLMALLGGDIAEVVDRLEEIAERVVTSTECGNE